MIGKFMKNIFLLPDGGTIKLANISNIGKIMISDNPSQNIMGFTISFRNGSVENVLMKFTNKNKLQINTKLQTIRNNLIESINLKKTEVK